MAITAELREWKGNIIADLRPEMVLTLRRQLNSIADRIDAEHERMFRSLTIDAEPMTDESMAEHGWVRLPVDADGVPIRVGDRLEHVNGAFTANDMTVSIDGLWRAWDGENGHTVLLSKCHHHAPTVEGVLEEMLREYDRDDSELTNSEIIEHFAAKLRLAGDGE